MKKEKLRMGVLQTSSRVIKNARNSDLKLHFLQIQNCFSSSIRLCTMLDQQSKA